MSKSICFFLVAIVLVISNALPAQTQDDEFTDGCKVDRSMVFIGPEPYTFAYVLTCYNFNANHLPFKEEYKTATAFKLSGNFTEMSFDPRYDPHYVHLTYGDVTRVSVAAFKGFKNLVSISIDSYAYHSDGVSLISVFDLTDAGVMTSVREIDLSSNSISKIRGGTFKESFPMLEELDLSNNKLTRVNFKNLPDTLTHLDLSDNAVSTFVGRKALKSFSRLTYLNVAYNEGTFDVSRYEREQKTKN